MAVDVETDWDTCNGSVFRLRSIEPEVLPCVATEEVYEGEHCECWRELIDKCCCWCGEKRPKPPLSENRCE